MNDRDIVFPIVGPDDELEADLQAAVDNPSGLLPAWVMQATLGELKAANERTRRRLERISDEGL